MRNLTKDSAIRLLLLLSLFLVGAPAGVSPPARALVPNGIQASDYSVSTTESVPVTINVLANDSCLISGLQCPGGMRVQSVTQPSAGRAVRSEEHTSELQSQSNLVCRLLLEKKNTKLVHPYLPLTLYPILLSIALPTYDSRQLIASLIHR